MHYVGDPKMGRLDLVMEKHARHTHDGWAVGDLAPVLMRADVQADLTPRENWAFASELVIGDHF